MPSSVCAVVELTVLCCLIYESSPVFEIALVTEFCLLLWYKEYRQEMQLICFCADSLSYILLTFIVVKQMLCICWVYDFTVVRSALYCAHVIMDVHAPLSSLLKWIGWMSLCTQTHEGDQGTCTQSSSVWSVQKESYGTSQNALKDHKWRRWQKVPSWPRKCCVTEIGRRELKVMYRMKEMWTQMTRPVHKWWDCNYFHCFIPDTVFLPQAMYTLYLACLLYVFFWFASSVEE